MPVDMMLEAMKVVYTKSRSRSSLHSRTSLSKGSQYGFLGRPSQSQLPVSSIRNEASREDSDFSVSFSVKVATDYYAVYIVINNYYWVFIAKSVICNRKMKNLFVFFHSP